MKNSASAVLKSRNQASIQSQQTKLSINLSPLNLTNPDKINILMKSFDQRFILKDVGLSLKKFKKEKKINFNKKETMPVPIQISG